MHMHPIESTSISHLGYDPDTGTMAVQYKSGSHTYHAAGVSPEQFEGLQAAKSKGSHLAKMGLKLVKAAPHKPMARSLMVLVTLTTLLCAAARAQYTTLTGSMTGANGVPGANLTISFKPSQTFFVPATGVVVSSTAFCVTSSDGTVVGLPDPKTGPITSTTGTGTLAAGNYFVQVSFYDASGNVTLASPEVGQQLFSPGSVVVSPPSAGLPAGATGMRVFIGATSGSETFQGSTSGSASFTQSAALGSGTSAPTSNTTVCKIIANDAGWPVGTGYTVGLNDASGNQLPNFPMMWQINGPNTTYNLSSGFPYYHGVVIYPSPILAVPTNHAQQSISGNLSLGSYNLYAGSVIATAGSFSGNVDALTLSLNHGAPLNHLLIGDGSHYVDSATIPASAISGLTLSYQTVQANSSSLPQQPRLNLSPRFAVSNNAGNTSTDVDLAGTVTPGTCTNCTITYDAYGRIVAVSSGTGTTTLTQNELTGSRSLGTTYQNTSGAPMMVQGYITTTAGGADGQVNCSNGPTSGLGANPFSDNPTATDSGGHSEFHITVPTGWYYQCTATGTMNASLTKWFESHF